MKITVVIISIFLLAIGGFFLLGKNQTVIPNQINKVSVTPSISRQLPKETVVTLTNEGFSPKEIKIASGDAVRFVNTSTQTKASVNSDDYPTNRKYPELNLGIFQKNTTLVHIFKETGTYTYHNQFSPTQRGTIIVN